MSVKTDVFPNVHRLYPKHSIVGIESVWVRGSGCIKTNSDALINHGLKDECLLVQLTTYKDRGVKDVQQIIDHWKGVQSRLPE